MIRTTIEEAFIEFNDLSENEKEKLPHINCCERVLLGSNISLNLNLNEDVFTTAKGFGGGMKIESVCGALTGSIMAMSHYYKEQDNLSEIIQTFFAKFELLHGTHMCDRLKDVYYDDLTGCQNVMIKAADVFDDILNQYPRNEVKNEQ